MFTCPLCTKKFRYLSRLDYHIVTHTKEKPHKCPICQEAFGSKGGVKQHLKFVHDGVQQTRNTNHHSAELPSSCPRPGCGYRTKSKHYLSQHVLGAHSDKRPFKCSSGGCSYKGKTRAHIESHLRVHSNDKPFACTIPGCNHTSKCKNELKRHTSRVHSNEKKLKCSVCDFRTNYRSSLRLHQDAHTKPERFQCQAPNCGYASHHRSYLKLHFDRNHRTKEVLCTEPRCNFKCGSVALLKRHLKTHQLPMLKCLGDSCGYRTKYNRCFLKHMSRHHNDLQSSVTVAGTCASDLKTAGTMNTLKCSFTDCSFQTKTQKLYDRHVVTHNNKDKGQHVCSFCFSSFRKLHLLKAHVKIHTREKPYSCSHCSHTTMYSSMLKAHARNMHQIYVAPRGKDDQVKKCRTCNRNCFSYGESVLHSMSHLQPVVVLEQLKLFVL